MDTHDQPQPAVLPPAEPISVKRKLGCGCVAIFVVLVAIVALAGGGRRDAKVAPGGSASSSVTIDAGSTQSPADVYGERLQTYWLPAAKALPTSLPADEAEVGRLLTEIDGFVVNINDGATLSLSKQQAQNRAALIAVLKERQQKLLPEMRRRYAEALDAKLFRRDVRVTASGTRASIMALTGGVFSLNANVEDMQTGLLPTLRRLRFKTTRYRWNEQLGGTLRYDLDGPKDDAIGTWVGDTFEPVATGYPAGYSATAASSEKPEVRDPACVPKLAASIGLSC